MATIDLDALKSANPIAEVAARLGVELKRNNGPCPKCGGTDRFFIDPRKGFWGCRGCHEKPGDAIALVQFVQGCEFSEAVEFLGARIERKAPVKPRDAGKDTAWLEKLLKEGRPSWEFRDELDELLAIKVLESRDKDTGKKNCLWFRPQGDRFVLGGPDRKTLYRLPEVAAAIAAGKPVWLHEGEKGADRMRQAGHVCTTHGYGSGKWWPEHNEQLRGAKLVIVADRDPQGERWAQMVVESVRPYCEAVRICQSGTTGDHDDAFDHFEAGMSLSQLVRREDLCRPTVLDELVTFNGTFAPVELQYLWEPYLPLGKVVLVDADGGVGKTSLEMLVAACLSNGHLPFSDVQVEPIKTLFLGHGEDTDEELETVYRANGGKQKSLYYYQKGLTFDQAGLDKLRQMILAGGFKLVIFDGIFDFVKNDPNDTQKMAQEMGKLARLASETGACFMVSRHVGKSSDGKATSNLGMGSAMIRNKARGQLVLCWHKDKTRYKGVVVVQDCRGSILRKAGAPFAFRKTNGFQIELLPDCDLSDYAEDYEPPKRGPEPYAKRAATECLEKLLLERGSVRNHEALAHVMRTVGCKDRTVYNARKLLKVVERGGYWSLPEGYDPYDEDHDQPHWAGLD